MASLSILSALAWVLTVSVVIDGFVDDIHKALEKAVDCPTCHGILAVLVPLAFLGDSAFSNTLITICKAAKVTHPKHISSSWVLTLWYKVQDFDVCEGIISQQGPIIAHDLRRAGPFGKAATRLCNSLTGLCQQPPVTPYSLQFANPRPTAPKVWSSAGKAPFQVVHFSDVHIDRSYVVSQPVMIEQLEHQFFGRLDRN